MGILTIRDKMDALSALGAEISIHYRGNRDIGGGRKLYAWYVRQYAEIKNGCVLKRVTGDGDTPEDAINDYWQNITDIKPEECIILNAGNRARKAVRWNGLMWERIEEEKWIK